MQTFLRPHARPRGFTLIELMIVVALIAILAAIALPSYREHVLKSRRTEAKNAVLDLAGRQERFFSIRNTYSSNAAALGYGTGSAFALNVNATGTSHYTIEAVATPASTSGGVFTPASFIAIARPIGAQVADTACHAFRIDSLGRQSNLDAAGAVLAGTGCW